MSISGSIEWRGKSKDHARLVISNGLDANGQQIKKRKNLGKVTKKIAKQELAKFITENNQNTVIDDRNMTFSDLVMKWKKDRWTSSQLRAKTKQRYEELLTSRITPVIGSMKLRDIRPNDIERLINSISQSKRQDGKGLLSPRTVLHYFVMLKTIFNCAIEWGYLSVNPVRKSIRPKTPSLKTSCYDLEDVKMLTQALNKTDIQHKTIVMLALSIGCRMGELAGLRWDCVDLESTPATLTINSTRQYIDKEHGVIVGKPKTEESIRTCILPSTVSELLIEYRKAQEKNAALLGTKWTESGYVFTNLTGKPLHPSSPSAWFRCFLARNKLPPLRFHGLRHTCATLLLTAQTDLPTVSELLGHSTVMTTANCYAHPTKKSKQAAALTMDNLLSNNSN